MTERSAERLADEILVLRVQQGDEAALARLVENWQGRLFTHARRLLRDEDAAWDVVQESLIAVVRQIGALQHVHAFPAWIYRITTGKCMDWLRARNRLAELERRWTEEEAIRARSVPEPASADALRRALSQLSETDRVLVELRYREGFSTRETASILAIPEGTVKSRLSRARLLLQSFLKGERS